MHRADFFMETLIRVVFPLCLFSFGVVEAVWAGSELILDDGKTIRDAVYGIITLVFVFLWFPMTIILPPVVQIEKSKDYSRVINIISIMWIGFIVFVCKPFA